MARFIIRNLQIEIYQISYRTDANLKYISIESDVWRRLVTEDFENEHNLTPVGEERGWRMVRGVGVSASVLLKTNKNGTKITENVLLLDSGLAMDTLYRSCLCLINVIDYFLKPLRKFESYICDYST